MGGVTERGKRFSNKINIYSIDVHRGGRNRHNNKKIMMSKVEGRGGHLDDENDIQYKCC